MPCRRRCRGWKIAVKGDEIKQALLQGGSPATPDDLRKNASTPSLNERCRARIPQAALRYRV